MLLMCHRWNLIDAEMAMSWLLNTLYIYFLLPLKHKVLHMNRPDVLQIMACAWISRSCIPRLIVLHWNLHCKLKELGRRVIRMVCKMVPSVFYTGFLLKYWRFHQWRGRWVHKNEVKKPRSHTQFICIILGHVNVKVYGCMVFPHHILTR